MEQYNKFYKEVVALSLFARDVGIDLGTSYIRAVVKNDDKKAPVSEPSVALINIETGQVDSFGFSAERALGRTPSGKVAIRPIKSGAISDYEATEYMLKEIVRTATSGIFRPRIAIAVPPSITDVEERAVVDVGLAAGASKVYLIESALAAAIGAGIEVSGKEKARNKRRPGRMVVDIGGGTTDVAIITDNEVQLSESIPVGGALFDEEFVKYIKKEKLLTIGDTLAEAIKKSNGTVSEKGDQFSVEITGRELTSARPKTENVSMRDIIQHVYKPLCERVIDVIRSVNEKTTAALASDIAQRGNGIILTGGMAHLHGLDEYISSKMNLEVTVADNPERCVINGMKFLLTTLDNRRDGVRNFTRTRLIRGY
ncbi:MAG: rod shape-determining protein [Oscillospiraceae bacterium]|nr:rod shape-determining protein [Oscillospiraceae bacterium]